MSNYRKRLKRSWTRLRAFSPPNCLLARKPIDYAEEEGRFIIHFAKNGEPVLLEILDAKEFVINSLTSVIEEKEVAIS